MPTLQGGAVEIDLNDLSFPLTKEGALALQKELHDEFSKPLFQARLRDLEEVRTTSSMEFKKAQQELVFDVQREIIPKYGFPPSLDGVGEMRMTFKRQFSDDDEVNANTEAINRLVAKTSDLESEEQRAAILEMTLERALALQDELRAAFSTSSFQSKLSKAQGTHGLDTLMFKKAQQEMVLGVQKQIIIKYGFKPSQEGVAEMRLAVRKFSNDSRVSANIATINRLIGQDRDDATPLAIMLAGAQPEPEPVSITNAVRRYQRQVSPAERGSVGVEIDMDNLGMPLTLKQAKELQWQLRIAFSKSNFQMQLWESEDKFGYDSLQFKKVQQELVRSAQKKIITNFGYEMSDEGVMEMRKDVNAFAHNEEVRANIEACNQLIGKIDDPAIRSEFKRSQLKKFEPTRIYAEEGANYWVVVGDGYEGGILVRLGEGTTSLAHREPLCQGAIVKAVLQTDKRISFEKMTGSGPNYGWVSREVKGKPLLERYVGDIELERKVEFIAIQDAPTVKTRVEVKAIEDKPQLLAIVDKPRATRSEFNKASRWQSPLEIQMQRLAGVGQAYLENIWEPVHLTRDQAVSLQNELISGFSSKNFQERLQQSIKMLVPPSMEFRKAQQELLFEVQKKIMPKYGFRESYQGVADMRKAVLEFEDDTRVSANLSIINRLIGK